MIEDEKFQEYTDSILKKSKRNIDDLIDLSVKKSRIRKRRTQAAVVFSSFILVFISFTLFLNFNDDFYASALENDYLKTLAETLRFKDIYKDPPKESLGDDDFEINISKPIHKEVIDVEEISIEMPVSENSWFSYNHSDKESHYFIELEHSEGMYDPVIALWKYDFDKGMDKLLDLKANGFENLSESLESFSELNGVLYLSSSEEEYTRIYKVENEQLSLIDESLRHHFYYTNTYVNFIKSNDTLWYASLNDSNKGYCYTLKNVLNKKEQKIDCFKEKLDPHLVPIMHLAAMNEKYLVFNSSQTSILNWEENAKEVDLTSEVKVYNRRGKLMGTYDGANELELVGNVLILQKEIDETYDYELIDLKTGKKEQLDDASKLYYNLKDRGVAVFAFSGSEKWFDSTKVSGQNFKTSTVRFETTKDTIENQFLVFNYTENPVLIFEDNNKQKIYFYKLVFK